MLLAIDVGTSNSSAAMPINGTPAAIKVGAEDYAVPSAVLVDESGGLLIGSAAVNRRVSAPERYKDNFKRDFGMDKSYELGGVTVTPEEIYEAYFRFFKEGCEQTGAVADEVTVTHPANFSDRKKGILSDIIKNVFLLDGDKIRLIEEPKAALYTFPTENMKPDDIVVVYDLGGGTLDVALARITAEGLITVEGYEGTDLGGTDFDSLIRRDIIEKLEISNERLKNNRLKQLLLDIPVKAKHALSVTEDCSLTISLDYDDYSVTRADFNQMLEPLMDRSDELIERLLENTGYDKEDITRVMCVGGSSCVPYVLERVEKAMGMRPLTSPKPDLAVCLGATGAGDFTIEDKGEEEEEEIKEVEPEVEIVEVNLESEQDAELSKEKEKIKPFLMPVEDVFIITGRGTAVTGHVESGTLKLGDEVEIVGLTTEKRKVVVTGIEMFRKLIDYTTVGDNVGLLLRGVNRNEIERGQVLAKPGTITAHTKFTAQVYVLKQEEGGRHKPIFNNYRPQFYFRTIDVIGVVILPEDREWCMPGDNIMMTVELIAPIAMEKGVKFAIREGRKIVGAGSVVDIIQ